MPAFHLRLSTIRLNGGILAGSLGRSLLKISANSVQSVRNRALNDCTADASWPIPNIAEMFRRIGNQRTYEMYHLVSEPSGFDYSVVTEISPLYLD